MIELLFDIDDVTHKEMAIFDNIKEMQDFIKTYISEVLLQYPNAVNIRLGKCYIGI